MKNSVLTLFLTGILTACQPSTGDAPQDKPMNPPSEQPDWRQQPTIYEVNIRQYTPEGTFTAFARHLPRLEKMGVKILWIMPVQPIGVKNRKGGLGSYYSIADYTAVNPNFGTLDDFKDLVQEAHQRGMLVILDWVANHSAYDHPWTPEHPEWYLRDEQGQIQSPVADWSDVADLNYDDPALREAMIAEMKFWLRETDLDGFRCDVAYMVPMSFWETARKELEKLKPLFMLAEAEGPEFHSNAFDMTYGWELHHLMNDVAAGKADLRQLATYYSRVEEGHYQPTDLRMHFTTNHDENSWNGTVYERMGANHRNFFVLCATYPMSVPLVYSGQEAGLNQALAFFEKDSIDWSNMALESFYQKILHLKLRHPALINDMNQAGYRSLVADSAGTARQVLAYERSRGKDKLFVLLNFGPDTAQVAFPERGGPLYNLMNGKQVHADDNQLQLSEHSFVLLSNRPIDVP